MRGFVSPFVKEYSDEETPDLLTLCLALIGDRAVVAHVTRQNKNLAIHFPFADRLISNSGMKPYNSISFLLNVCSICNGSHSRLLKQEIKMRGI